MIAVEIWDGVVAALGVIGLLLAPFVLVHWFGLHDESAPSLAESAERLARRRPR